MNIALIVIFVLIVVLSSIFVSEKVLKSIKKYFKKLFEVLSTILFGSFCFVLLAKICWTLNEICESFKRKTAMDDFSNYLKDDVSISGTLKDISKVNN